MNSWNCIWYTYFPPICLVKPWGLNVYLKFNIFLHYEYRQQTTQQSYWSFVTVFYYLYLKNTGVSGGSEGEESACNVGDLGSIPGLGRSPGRGHSNPLQCSCMENPHGQRSLVGYSPWGHKESDTTEWLSTHTHKYPVKGFTNHSIEKVHGTSLQTLGKILKGKKAFFCMYWGNYILILLYY